MQVGCRGWAVTTGLGLQQKCKGGVQGTHSREPRRRPRGCRTHTMGLPWGCNRDKKRECHMAATGLQGDTKVDTTGVTTGM